jgi:hypothetical protein
MNTKLLCTAAVGLALASSYALADEAPLGRADASAETQQATRIGLLRRTDWDDELAARPVARSSVARSQVVATLHAPADPRLVGPLRNRTYNPYGTEAMRAPVASRAEVRSQVLEARADGTLRPAGEAESPFVVAHSPRQVPSLFAFMRRHQ